MVFGGSKGCSYERRCGMGRWLVLVLLMLPLGGCDGAPSILFGKRIDGVVLDAETGQPVAGAYVTYRWQGEAMGEAFSAHNAPVICYHAAAAVTDAQGRFHIDPWEKKPTYKTMNEEPYAEVYARGYVPEQAASYTGPRHEPVDRPNDVIRIKKSNVTGAARLEELNDATMHDCIHGGESQRSLYSMLKVAYAEAREIAVAPNQKQGLDFFRRRAARAFLAPDPTISGDRTSVQIQEFIR